MRARHTVLLYRLSYSLIAAVKVLDCRDVTFLKCTRACLMSLSIGCGFSVLGLFEGCVGVEMPLYISTTPK